MAIKKGQSGNPSGRRKSAKSLSECFLEALDEKVTINENGIRRKITKWKALLKQLVNKAVSGDIKSIKLALEFMGALDERERLTRSEATYRDDSSARERLTKKLDQMHERLLAGRPLFDDTDTE